MNPERIYQKMVEKLNKNFSNSSISLDRARAVDLFNEEQLKFVEWSISKRNSYLVEDVQILLNRIKLNRKSKGNNFFTFELPSNFFTFVNLEVKAHKGSCGIADMLSYQIKPEDKQEILHDDNNKPSFEFREVPYTIENNLVYIYVDGFEIDSVYLNYYRYPREFNIKGYIDIDRTNSFDSEPEFEDRIVNRIISMCATSWDINMENLNKVQVDMNRVVSKF